MTVAAVVAVPAAPLLLPAASPAQPADVAPAVGQLRAASRKALAALPAVDTVVLLAAGNEPRPHLRDAPTATLASYGLPAVQAPISVDTDLLTALATRGQAARARAGRLDGDLAVLALQIVDAWPDVPLVPAEVPAGADADSLTALAAGLGAAADEVGRRIAVVAAGDLSAARGTTSPGYLVEGATDWDAAAVAAVRAADVAALASLGPEPAAKVQARGWAPLVVLLHVARLAGLTFDTVTELAPRGVGQLVAH